MHRIPIARSILFGVITAFTAGLVVFTVGYDSYPFQLSVDTIQSLARNGKSVSQASAEFGYVPALLVITFMLANVADRCPTRRQLLDTQGT